MESPDTGRKKTNIMPQETFREFLEIKHSEGYTGTDDDMPDAFDNWLTTLSPDDYMEYGQQYGDQRSMDGV